MKTKSYILLSALLLSTAIMNAQYDDNRNFRDEGAGVVINNYYPDNDYYYASRIKRFHQSYAAFDYYAPVFTDVYWYNYQPFTWGVSIYGGNAPFYGYAYTHRFAGFGFNYGYNDGWYDPYAGNYYYDAFNPYYYDTWFSPVRININFNLRFGSFWP
jgi:hypothetical protein